MPFWRWLNNFLTAGKIARYLKQQPDPLPAPSRRKRVKAKEEPQIIDRYKEDYTAQDWENDRKIMQAVSNARHGVDPSEIE